MTKRKISSADFANDPVLAARSKRSKAVARRENSTLKALIEEGLLLALRARSRRRAAPFAVQPFHGDGLTPEFAAAGWDRIRDEIYRDRG